MYVWHKRKPPTQHKHIALSYNAYVCMYAYNISIICMLMYNIITLKHNGYVCMYVCMYGYV
jgi:hypothetical protein